MIFYTAITNGYDKLAPPPKSNVKFICFYDGDQPDTEPHETTEEADPCERPAHAIEESRLPTHP